MIEVDSSDDMNSGPGPNSSPSAGERGFLFLSYSKRDKTYAVRDLERLRLKGHKVWFDEDSIQPGEPWETVIADAIQNCGALVLLGSVNGYITSNVVAELHLARRFHKPIFVIDLDGTKAPASLDWLLRFQHLAYEDNGSHIFQLSEVFPPAELQPPEKPEVSGNEVPAEPFDQITEMSNLGAWTIVAPLTRSAIEATYRGSLPDLAGLPFEELVGLVHAKIKISNLEHRLEIWKRTENHAYSATRTEAIALVDWYRELLIALKLADPAELSKTEDGLGEAQHAEIFLSFAAPDNEPLIGGNADSRWVSNLCRYVRTSLAEHLELPGPRDVKLWMELGNAATSEPSPEALVALQNASLFIAVLSPAYLQSARCKAERETFFAAAGGRDAAAGRVFVVETVQVEGNWRSEFCPSLLTFPFFEPNGEQGRLLGSPMPADNDDSYFQRVRALRTDVAEVLRPTAPNGQRPKVFVAEASMDLFDEWDKLRNHLQYKGYDVLPVSEYFRDRARYEASATEDLAPALLFLQLLGRHPIGTGPELPANGYDELLLDCAIAQSKHTIRWRPKGLRLEEVRPESYRPFVGAPDVLEMDFEELKRLVEARLRQLVPALRKIDAPPMDRLAGGGIVGLVGHEWDHAKTEGMTGALRNAGMGWDLIPRGVDLNDIVPSEDFSGIIVVPGSCPVDWLRTKLRECRRLWLKRLPRMPATGLFIEKGRPPIHFSTLTLIRNLSQELHQFLEGAAKPADQTTHG